MKRCKAGADMTFDGVECGALVTSTPALSHQTATCNKLPYIRLIFVLRMLRRQSMLSSLGCTFAADVARSGRAEFVTRRGATHHLAALSSTR